MNEGHSAPDIGRMADALLQEAGADVINVAESPVARMRMSAWAVCEIVQRRVPGLQHEALGTLVELAGRLRELPLRKPPSISEVVDAARAAAAWWAVVAVITVTDRRQLSQQSPGIRVW